MRLLTEEQKAKRKAYMAVWRSKNAEYRKEYRRKYSAENRDAILLRQRKHYQENREKCIKQSQAYYWKHPEERRRKARERVQRDPEKYKALRLERYRSNRERYIEIVRNSQKRNIERVRAWERQYRNKKYRDNPGFRLAVLFKTRINKIIGGKQRGSKALKLDRAALVSHIEKQFKPGMTWENHGKAWHVDHIKPCASFDLTDPKQVGECFALSNLQPLWKNYNLSKGAKSPEEWAKELDVI